MRISVQFEGSDHRYAYDTSLPVRPGDVVEVPAAGSVKIATVVDLSSNYGGTVSQVQRVLRRAE